MGLNEHLNKIIDEDLPGLTPGRRPGLQSGVAGRFPWESDLNVDTRKPFSEVAAQLSEKFLEDTPDLSDGTKSNLKALSSKLSPKDFQDLLNVHKDVDAETFAKIADILEENPEVFSLLKDENGIIQSQIAENVMQLKPETLKELSILKQQHPEMVQNLMKKESQKPEVVDDLASLKKQLTPLQLEQMLNLQEKLKPEIFSKLTDTLLNTADAPQHYIDALIQL